MTSFSKTWPVPTTDRRRFLLSLAALAAAPAWSQGGGMTPVPGLPKAPPLALTDMDDKPVDLGSYKGWVVLVNFWASWCPPCRKEFPSLGRLRKRLGAEDFEVLAVNVGEDPDTAFSFAGHTSFPILFDRQSSAMARWPVKGLPTSFLIDRQGRLALQAVGGREFDDPAIISAIRELLKR